MIENKPQTTAAETGKARHLASSLSIAPVATTARMLRERSMLGLPQRMHAQSAYACIPRLHANPPRSVLYPSCLQKFADDQNSGQGWARGVEITTRRACQCRSKAFPPIHRRDWEKRFNKKPTSLSASRAFPHLGRIKPSATPHLTPQPPPRPSSVVPD